MGYICFLGGLIMEHQWDIMEYVYMYIHIMVEVGGVQRFQHQHILIMGFNGYNGDRIVMSSWRIKH